MTDIPYTDADVELVADAIVDTRLQGHRDWTDRIACAVLAALAAAGRLTSAEQRDALAALRDTLDELADRTAEARGARDDYEQLKGFNAELADERDRLFTTLADVLGNFREKGHPGTPCIRTGWVREETYAQWHGVLAGIVAADGPSRD